MKGPRMAVMEKARASSPGGGAVLRSFPANFGELPEPHRQVLAVVAAFDELGHAPVSRARLYRTIARTVTKSRRPGHAMPFDRFGLDAHVARVVGNLSDYGLLEIGGQGLSLSSRARDARDGWNGEFRSMVATASRYAKGISR